MEEHPVKQPHALRRTIAYGIIGLFLLAYVYRSAIGPGFCVLNRCISYDSDLGWFWLFTLVFGVMGMVLAVISMASLIDMLLKLPENKRRAMWARMEFLLSFLKSRTLHLVLAAAVYAVAMFVGTHWVIFLYFPCRSDFEGGCGYASFFAGIFSFFAAWTALGAAMAMLAIALSVEDKKTQRWINIFAGILMIPPVFYIGYCMGGIFREF